MHRLVLHLSAIFLFLSSAQSWTFEFNDYFNNEVIKSGVILLGDTKTIILTNLHYEKREGIEHSFCIVINSNEVVDLNFKHGNKSILNKNYQGENVYLYLPQGYDFYQKSFQLYLKANDDNEDNTLYSTSKQLRFLLNKKPEVNENYEFKNGKRIFRYPKCCGPKETFINFNCETMPTLSGDVKIDTYSVYQIINELHNDIVFESYQAQPNCHHFKSAEMYSTYKLTDDGLLLLQKSKTPDKFIQKSNDEFCMDYDKDLVQIVPFLCTNDEDRMSVDNDTGWIVGLTVGGIILIIFALLVVRACFGRCRRRSRIKEGNI